MSTPPVAVVTGASSGIGAALVVRLLGRGYRVVAVVRRPEAVAALPDGDVGGLVADLATPAGLAAVEAELARGPALLVHAAATGRHGPLAAQDPEALTELAAVNVLAPLRLLAAALRAEVAGVVLVSSTASTARVPHLAPYAASKAFLDSLAASVRAQPGPTTLTLVRPGYVRSGFHARLSEDVSAVPARLWQTPDAVAVRVLAAHDRGAGAVTLDVPGAGRRAVRAAAARALRGTWRAVTRRLGR